jgi:3-isopropylmalate/(R)-2-methylmalate dehydratase small subunit
VTTPDGQQVPFDIDPFRKHCLLHGLDDIAQTLEKAVSIQTFEEKQMAEQPWLFRE